MNARPIHRILTIDGGGIVGTYPAAFLAELETHLPLPIGSYFDLIVGTSTGGIIAIGLAMGLKASEILALYEEHGPAIFGQHRGPMANWLLRRVRGARALISSKHDTTNLRKALERVLGDRKIGDATTRLVVPSWSPARQSVYIYKTAHHERLRSDYKESAIDVALATSAAPTFLAEHTTESGLDLIDGGVWANNPIEVGVVEGISLLDWPREQIRVLSLGCARKTYTLPKRGGKAGYALKMLDLFMDCQSKSAIGMAGLLTNHNRPDRAIWRIEHSVGTGRYSLDDTSKIAELKGLGVAEAREQFPHLEQTFFRSPAEPFMPVYSLQWEVAE